MTKKEHKFYKKLLENNNDRHKNYRKLFKVVDKHYNFLNNDVANLYIEDNKKNLYELNNIKHKLLGGKYAKSVDNSKYKYELQNILEKVYKLTGGDLADIVSALGSVSTISPSTVVDPTATATATDVAANISPVAIAAATDDKIKSLLDKLTEFVNNNKDKPGLIDLINTITKLFGASDSIDVIQKNFESVSKSLKLGQEETKNEMNNIIAGFFEQFAENTPQWMRIQEYSKDYDNFTELQYLMKNENRESASDEKLELDIAIAFAKLGALFTPSAPGALTNSAFNPTIREKNLARGALEPSGLVMPEMIQATTTTNAKGGAAPPAPSAPSAPSAPPAPPAPAKSDEEKEKNLAKAAKEENDMIAQVKKDTNDIMGILGQIQSRYKKSYSFEADDIKEQDKFADNKEKDLKRMLTNGELSNDERTLVSKWASIKEEQKWITELDSQIKKAKELYDNVQKSITKLATAPNDPELAEIIRSLTLLNDGNLDAQVPFEKDSIPNHLAKVLTEITSAYQVVVKGYNSAGESVTKRSQQTSSSSAAANSSNASVNEANKVLDRLRQKLLTFDKITNYNDEIEKELIKGDTQIKTYNTWKNDPININLIKTLDDEPSSTPPSTPERTNLITAIRILINSKVKETTDTNYYTKLNKNLENISKALDALGDLPAKYELPTLESVKKDKGNNTIDAHITEISEAISHKIIRAMIRPIEMKLKTRLSPEYGILADNPTLLDDIYNRYQKSKASEGNLISAINLENLLNANDLIPSEVLKITSLDKMIFAFIIITFRLISVTLVEYMIEHNWILSLGNGIIAFGVIYTLLFITFVVVVNFDLWRLRILFNYVNMHVNTSIILTHLAMVWGLLGVVLLLIFNINFNMTGLATTITTEEDKARLEYRLEMITLILWLVILFLVVIF